MAEPKQIASPNTPTTARKVTADHPHSEKLFAYEQTGAINKLHSFKVSIL
jgi:hypothetical protein